MRYKTTEATNILVNFPDNLGAVTIDIIFINTSFTMVSGAPMTEINNTGIFKYLFSGPGGEYLWIATDGVSKKFGKIVRGGYIDETLTTTDFITLS